MSYDIYLRDPVTHAPMEADAPHQIIGGTYALGGTQELWLNVTYNYTIWYYKDGVFPIKDGKKHGIRTIYGMSGAESIHVLKNAIRVLESLTEDISDEDRKKCEEQNATGYWMPTRANAIRPLYSLLEFAQTHPNGIWEGD